jgi:hypothetical protein
MIQTSAVAKSSIIGVACSVLCVFNILFSLAQLIVSPEEVNQLGKNWILVGLLFKHALELLHCFLILIAFQQNLRKD